MFLDSSVKDFHTYNYKQESDWTDGLCSCCQEDTVVSITYNITHSTLGKIFSRRRIEIFFLFFPENKF